VRGRVAGNVASHDLANRVLTCTVGQKVRHYIDVAQAWRTGGRAYNDEYLGQDHWRIGSDTASIPALRAGHGLIFIPLGSFVPVPQALSNCC
jgi:hypothetical protein